MKANCKGISVARVAIALNVLKLLEMYEISKEEKENSDQESSVTCVLKRPR